jgi:hypothetical protein
MESTEERRATEVTERRQLQASGGFSIEVTAIVFTGIIGMIGYLVQARSVQRATEAQTSLERDAAEREKAEVKAGKQLERVQLQLAEFVYPVQIIGAHFNRAFEYAVRRCGLEVYAATYCFEWHSPPAQPHVSIFNGGNPKILKAWSANPFVHTLAPKDLARLAADPEKRRYWIELVTHGLLPPLRELVPILRTKVRTIVLVHSPCQTKSMATMTINRRADAPGGAREARRAGRDAAWARAPLGRNPGGHAESDLL